MENKRLIVGLGNPGEKYAGTRHNIGFQVGEKVVNEFVAHDPKGRDFSLNKKFNASVVEFDNFFVMKPQTYMNLSGDAVGSFANFYKIPVSNIWVVSDDVNLPLGTIRVRKGGSSGGHRGLQSIIDKVGDGFYRFRLGIHSEQRGKIPTDRFVITDFTESEQQRLDRVISGCLEEMTSSLTPEPKDPEEKTITVE